MTLLTFFLVFLSCILHAGWNILGKASKGSSLSFSFAMSFFVSLLLTPYLVWYLNTVEFNTLPIQFWLLIVLSGISQAIYLIGLIEAYKHSDVSIAYPVVRSLPVLMVAVLCSLSGLLLSGWQWLGLSLIPIGCLLIPLTTLSDIKFSHYLNRGLLWVVISASGTAAYTIIDKIGLDIASDAVGFVIENQYTSIFYLGCQVCSTAVTIWLLAAFRGRPIQLSEVWDIKYKAGLTGLMMAVTYGLVLFAMTTIDNVSLLVALRQLSIVFGVLMGVWFLKEQWYLIRGIGVSTILLGLFMALY